MSAEQAKMPEWIKPGQRIAVCFGNDVMNARIVTVHGGRVLWQAEKWHSISQIDSLAEFTGGYRRALPVAENVAAPARRVPSWWRLFS